MARNPKPDSRGWFEPILGRAPADWPWALPHLYAVNVALDPAEEIVGATASPDGSSSLQHAYNPDRSRFEVIGFWSDEFRVVHVEHAPTRTTAEKQAANSFTSLPVRYLMYAGNTIRENPDVQITGAWPEHWQIQRYQDLGVLCAFIYEQARHRGAAEAAEDFRKLIRPASPTIEQIMIYRFVLERARDSLSRYLPIDALTAIHNALATIQVWCPELRVV